MRRLIRLQTADGRRIKVHLDNWGGGVDGLYRRWTREPDGWHCVDTGEIGYRTGLFGGQLKRPEFNWWG